MAAAYSMDLRKRVIADSDVGLSSKELAERYHVSRAWVDALKQRRRETGSIAARKPTKFRRRVLEGQEDRLRALITAQPGVTRYRPLRHWPPFGARLTSWTSPSKKTVHADEQRRVDVAAQRRQWREWLPLHDAACYVFLDECGVTTDLLRRYGRSPRGIRLHDHTPCSHWQTHTVIAALRPDALTAPAVFDGPIDNESFRAYVEQVLVPTLRPGDVVVLDKSRSR
jgi:transposase